MNSREIKYIDNNEITEEHIFLGIYEENSKESSTNRFYMNIKNYFQFTHRNIFIG
jgi:site-specific recombinase XerD